RVAPRRVLRRGLPSLRAPRLPDRPSVRGGRVDRRRARGGGGAAREARAHAEDECMRRLRILTWHTHGSYLYYLTQAPHDFYVLSKPGRPPGYAGRSGHLPWGDNVHDLPAEAARRERFDIVLFQDDAQYLEDQHVLLSPAQRRLPRIYLEHDPPQAHPTDTRHPADEHGVLVVHVTPFNALMWRHERAATRVVEHGVVVPPGV